MALTFTVPTANSLNVRLTDGGPDEKIVVVLILLLLVELDETVELVVVKDVVEKLDDDVDDRKLDVDVLLDVDVVVEVVVELLGNGAVVVVVDGPATLVVEVELLVVVLRMRVVLLVPLVELVTAGGGTFGGEPPISDVDVVEETVEVLPPGRVVVVLPVKLVVVPPARLLLVVPLEMRVVVVVGRPGVLAPGRGIASPSPLSSHPVSTIPASAATGEKQANCHTPRNNARRGANV